MQESGVANTACLHVGMSACLHVSFACLLEFNPTSFDKKLKERVAGANVLGNNAGDGATAASCSDDACILLWSFA